MAMVRGDLLEQRAKDIGGELVSCAQDVHTCVSTLDCAVELLIKCYTKDCSTNDHFTALRAQVTRSAFLYKDFHLPASTQLIKRLQEAMTLYEVLTQEEFLADVDVIGEELSTHGRYAHGVYQVHQFLLDDLEGISQEAEAVVASLRLQEAKARNDAVEFEKRAEALAKEKKKNAKMWWGIGALYACDVVLCAGVPVISGLMAAGGAVSAAAATSSMDDSKEAIRQGKIEHDAAAKKADNALMAAQDVEGSLMGSVRQFADAMSRIAGILKQLHADVSLYADGCARMKSNARTATIYFKTTRKYSANVLAACQHFNRSLPAIEARMQTLRSVGNTDPLYVKLWLTNKFGGAAQVKGIFGQQQAGEVPALEYF